MNEHQRKVDELIREFGGYWGPTEMLAALMEEVGELSREILGMEGVKREGNGKKLREELGDVLFALSCIANHYDVDLLEALEESIEKYRSRDSRRWEKPTST
ncbi:MazG nucleotide pyrophosphohydrolase domain-containing protein [Thermococcus sp.]|uniref:MazG nucleotide pyrophosphohydrolase domain-containing protein n=1 Tax=Thermococcus sp. TaxID=35749 RepID=UPI0026179FB3|nr:MazG nucleotide pyrophosphohydrolase domain-containing protein [Thermococcus sp.]